MLNFKVTPNTGYFLAKFNGFSLRFCFIYVFKFRTLATTGLENSSVCDSTTSGSHKISETVAELALRQTNKMVLRFQDDAAAGDSLRDSQML